MTKPSRYDVELTDLHGQPVEATTRLMDKLQWRLIKAHMEGTVWSPDHKRTLRFKFVPADPEPTP